MKTLATLLLGAALILSCDGDSPPATPTAGATLTGGPPTRAAPDPTQAAAPTATALPTATPAAPGDLPIVDMHFHPDDAWDVDELVALMDDLGVQQAVGGSGDSGAAALRFAAAQPGRFVPFAGQDGMRALNLLQGAPSWDLETPESLAYVAALEAQLQAGCWAGVGEAFVNTLASHVSGGFSVPADSPLMRRVFELAAQYGVPLSVHMDAAPESVASLRRLLDAVPEGAFIWAHAGWYTTPAQLRELLQAHANLYVELSFRDELRSFYPVTAGGVLQEDWRALLDEMPGRFLLGTDLNPPPTRQKYADLVLFWRGVLEQLSPDAARLLAYENARRLLDGQPASRDTTACVEMVE